MTPVNTLELDAELVCPKIWLVVPFLARLVSRRIENTTTNGVYRAFIGREASLIGLLTQPGT
jgi:hypothetical protein